MKKYEGFICAVLVILMSVLFIQIGTRNFNVEEASAAGGDGYDLSEEWTVIYEDGTDESIDLPKSFKQDEGELVLSHNLKSDYSGLVLSLEISNASVNVYVNDERIYTSGTANGVTNLPESDGRDVSKGDIGKLIIDLPEDISEDDVLELRVAGNAKTSTFDIDEASVSDRGVAVMEIVGSSMVPLLCAVLIIISAAILLGLDVIRMVNKKRVRGLIIIALYAVDTIFYTFVKTNIFFLFLGNRSFFNDLAEISYIIMPVFISGFFFRGFNIHFPKAVRVIFYSSAMMAITDLVTYPYWGQYYRMMSIVNLIWKLAVIGAYMIMLVKWQRLRPESRQIGMDEAALICLLTAVVSDALMSNVAHAEILNTLQIVAGTAYFLFMDVQHVQIMLAESRYQAEARARELEEKNRNLEIARNEAEEAKQDAILANEAKSRFLANMSHEIRTPINAVLGMDEMILREAKDKSIKDYAFDIRSAGRTLLSLINDILDFSKIESGKMEIVPVEYEFSQLVNDLVNMISTRAADKGLDFILDIDESIPSKMYGDDVRLRQCITNLLTNAVKYTPEGSMWLRIRGDVKADEVCTLHVEVEDTGIGIKEEDIPKLFVEYERIEESRNRNIEGTGLGMNITLQMLALMDTRLEVESVYGEGSKFFFDVDQRIIDDTPVGHINTRAKDTDDEVSGEGDAFIAPDARVLVVDDNDMNRKVFISLLKSTRMNIDEADCGPAAIEQAKANAYDMIFMDHMMPEMDGIEAMQAIRALETSPNENTPIYVLTANAVSGAREMYLEAGFDGFLSKPVVSERLVEALRDNLPEEKLLPAPEGEGIGKEADDVSGPPEDLPTVDGLDWTFAWLHLPSEEMLIDSVRGFYDLIDVQADKLETMYKELPGSAAMESYRIQVHGMKSLAATVGIIPLAGMAKVLEFAARDEKEDVIASLHNVFMDEWRSYKSKLIGVFDIKDPEEEKAALPPADYEATMAALDMLKDAMDDFDIDESDALLARLKSYRYPDEISAIMDKMSGAVADLDNDLVAELVENIIDKGEWE